MKKLLAQFVAEEDGAAMVEYTILLGIITVAVIGAVIFVGGWVGTQWTALQTTLP
jgi:pilus assembly protein Flp/PilA